MSQLKQILGVLFLLCTTCAFAEVEIVYDPLNSPSWDVMQRKFLSDHPVVFDQRVRVSAPDNAEDSLNVPVSVWVDDLVGVEKIVVFSDLNPIPLVLNFYPLEVRPYLAFRFKVQQATPIRAAALAADGKWHVGGKWIEAMGGGCTAPSNGRTTGNWANNLGITTGRVFDRAGDFNRLRFRVMHPMDTGLADGIPAFYIKETRIEDEQGKLLARLELFEPVNENPVISLDIADRTNALNIEGVDNNGNKFTANIK